MKKLLVGFCCLAISPSVGVASSVQAGIVAQPSTIVEHGGGCRKSSPPGQCCHMEAATGIVHCH